MPVANSSTLFHFTNRKSTLFKIIQNGLRFTYSFEPYSKEPILNEIHPQSIKSSDSIENRDDSKQLGVAIPMVCFCDIPIMRASEHKQKYGNYAIGFDKDFLSKLKNPILNPVWYMDSINVIRLVSHFGKMTDGAMDNILKLISGCSKNKTLITQFENDGPDAIFKNEELRIKLKQQLDTKFFAKALLGYSKPYGYKNSKNKYICNYDEREWRAILHDGIDEKTDWVWDLLECDFKSVKKSLNKRIETYKDGFITIPEDFQYQAITHIIVNEDIEIIPIIQRIMESSSLFGIHNISDEERLILVSKVTSFERIEKDY